MEFLHVLCGIDKVIIDIIGISTHVMLTQQLAARPLFKIEHHDTVFRRRRQERVPHRRRGINYEVPVQLVPSQFATMLIVLPLYDQEAVIQFSRVCRFRIATI